MLPMFQAVARRDVVALRQLLAEGADPNTISPFHGQSVLYNACALRDTESLRVLLEHGADPNLRLAIRSVVDQTVATNVTVLMYARDAESARLLIEFGADVDAVDDDGTSALMKAALFCKLEVLTVLLDHGADARIRQRSGGLATALEVAERKLAFWQSCLGQPGFKQDGVRTHLQRYGRIVSLLRVAAGGP